MSTASPGPAHGRQAPEPQAPNSYDSPFERLLGLEVEEATQDRVTASLVVSDRLHQPTGIVHGGVYASMVETVASIGAFVWLNSEGPGGAAVGVSNHTDFLRSVREGRLVATAAPVQRGRTLQLWTVDVTDDTERAVAFGTVKLMNLPVE